MLKISLNGGEYIFGNNSGKSITLDGNPILIEPGNNYKILFELKDGLPNSYQIINENLTTVPIILDENEYYLDASFRNLIIEVD